MRKLFFSVPCLFIVMASDLYAQNSYPSTGNVGLGNTSPQEPLSIASSNANTISLLRSATSGNVTAGTPAGAIYFGSYDPTATATYIGALIRAKATEAWTVGTAQGSALIFETVDNGTTMLAERMRIDKNGNVGIGVVTPAQKLDINGNVVIRGAGSIFFKDASGIGTPSFDLSGNASYIHLSGSGLIGRTDNAQDLGTGGYRFKNLNLGSNAYIGGNVGIGETAPVNKLDIKLGATINQWLSTVSVDNPAANALGSGIRFGWSYTNKVTGPSIRVVNGGDNNNAGIGFTTLLATSEVERMRIDAAGNVGIGATSPKAKLDVNGNVRGTYYISNISSVTDNFTYDNRSFNHYSVGWLIDSWNPVAATAWFSSYAGIKFFTGGTPQMFIDQSGNVGIGGAAASGYKLTVEGVIGARKVKVTNSTNWADYVFDKDYALPSLQEVENYINQNKHLPDVPSAKEVAANGVDIGDTQAVLLKKIEELTLYSIAQEKNNQVLQDTISAQNKKIAALEEQIKQVIELVKK